MSLHSKFEQSRQYDTEGTGTSPLDTSKAYTTLGSATWPNELKAGASDVRATVDLVSNNTNVSNADAVTLRSTTYTFKTNLTEAFATDTVGASGTPADGNTVVVNGRTYTFKTTLTPAAGEVLINSKDGSLTNLQHAINQSGGTVGTDYVTGAANAGVTAGAVASSSITLTAKVVGTGGNSLTLTRVGANLSVGGATFSGGVNPVANEVHIGGDADTSLGNLIKAINLSGTAGTDYASNTAANGDVVASSIGAHTANFEAVAGAGSAANSWASTTTASTLTFQSATLAGGADAVAGVKPDKTRFHQTGQFITDGAYVDSQKTLHASSGDI